MNEPNTRSHGDISPVTETWPNRKRTLLGAVVQVVGARAQPSTFRLVEGSCVIGTAKESDIVLEDRSVSRAHVELSVVSGGIALRDLGSRNGTYYLGQRVEKMVLSHGSEFTVGTAKILLLPDHAALAEATYEGDELCGIVGSSPAMKHLFGILARLERSTVTVLITGESGVGKELVARALHERSGVRGPLVSVNCGAIARELVTSELFGHRRGAFAGAGEERSGAFETADGGTLFLDEVGELPLDVQPRLLRVLEAGEIRPLGGDHSERVNVRVIAATNRDLEKDVREGRFREDLFYRLAVVKLEVPPLRERPEDLAPLASKFASAAGIPPLPQEVLDQLKRRPWPGNARELRNFVHSYAVLQTIPARPKSATTELDRSLSSLVDVSRPYAELKEELLERFQRVYLAELLAHVGGNQTQAAKLAGLDRTYTGRLIAKYGLEGASRRATSSSSSSSNSSS